jgi:hypothetical protein
LPPNPEIPTIHLKKAWKSSALAAALLLGGAIFAFLTDNGGAQE